jgi:hypothetical protein
MTEPQVRFGPLRGVFCHDCGRQWYEQVTTYYEGRKVAHRCTVQAGAVCKQFKEGGHVWVITEYTEAKTFTRRQPKDARLRDDR